MKKVFISLGIILVIAGIVIVGVYGGAKGFSDWDDLRVHDLSKADKTEEFAVTDVQNLQKIEVSADQFCVYFVKSTDANKVSVKYLSDLPEGVQVIAKYENEALKVTQTADKSVEMWQRIWSGEYLKFFVVVELPETETFENVEIVTELKEGAVFVDGLDLKNLQAKETIVCK